MNIEQIRDFCMAKTAVTEHFPFDDVTLVFKVAGKMFLIAPLNKWDKGQDSINLKCDPEYALELRADYESIVGGFHSNKKHWNTLYLHQGELKPQLIMSLINHSYDMVVKGMPKKVRERLQ